ncbi:MAG: hypothetical protein OIF55_03290 [Amphritea sp.]|nr:hypothetical protein [Amphritea sp.]
MSYEVKLDVLNSYVRVEVSGTRIPGEVADSSLAVWKKVAETCKKHQINHVLAVFHLKGQRTITDTLKIIEGAKLWVWPELMMAYVDSDENSQANNAILEQITLSHGISFRAFANEQQGIRWLENFHR